METSTNSPNPENVQSPFEGKYNALLEEHHDLNQRILQLEDWMCKNYAIKRYPRVIDLEHQTLDQLIASKFNIEIERVSNQFKLALQKANDEKGRLEGKLNSAKEKQDKLTEEKKVLTVQKEKLNKKIEQMKIEMDDKSKRLESAKKRISQLQQ